MEQFNRFQLEMNKKQAALNAYHREESALAFNIRKSSFRNDDVGELEKKRRQQLRQKTLLEQQIAYKSEQKRKEIERIKQIELKEMEQEMAYAKQLQHSAMQRLQSTSILPPPAPSIPSSSTVMQSSNPSPQSVRHSSPSLNRSMPLNHGAKPYDTSKDVRDSNTLRASNDISNHTSNHTSNDTSKLKHDGIGHGMKERRRMDTSTMPQFEKLMEKLRVQEKLNEDLQNQKLASEQILDDTPLLHTESSFIPILDSEVVSTTVQRTVYEPKERKFSSKGYYDTESSVFNPKVSKEISDDGLLSFDESTLLRTLASPSNTQFKKDTETNLYQDFPNLVQPKHPSSRFQVHQLTKEERSLLELLQTKLD